MARPGELFEQDVFEYFRGLDPEAVVLFNHKVHDPLTGVERQADVWVVYKLFGQFRITVLVSC